MNLRSFVSFFLTILGTILIILTIFLGVEFNKELQVAAQSKEELLTELDENIESLEQELALLTDGPLAQLVSVEAIAVELAGRSDQNGNQLYDFSMWIVVPNNRKNDIERVEYRRQGGEMLLSVLIGEEPTNGFNVSYLGWGCFRNVEVTIIEKSGKSTTLPFNQCVSVGWRV